MTYYAVFDPASESPRPVIGWINTELADYALPADGLFVLNFEQWAGRMSGRWAISDGTLTEITAPEPEVSPEQAAAAELGARLQQGIIFHSPDSVLEGAHFALDPTTLEQIGSVARDYAAGLGLPNDINVFGYPDYNGNIIQLSGDEVVKVYRAMRNLVSSLNQQTAVMAHGGAPQWPSQSADV